MVKIVIPSDVPLFYLDTNIFLYFFQSHPTFGPRVKKVFEQLENKKVTAITSYLTLSEILSFKIEDEAIEKIKMKFFSIPNLACVPIEKSVGLEAARIRRQYNFRLPDAIHLATATIYQVDKFFSNDKKLVNFSEIKTKILSDD